MEFEKKIASIFCLEKKRWVETSVILSSQMLSITLFLLTLKSNKSSIPLISFEILGRYNSKNFVRNFWKILR